MRLTSFKHRPPYRILLICTRRIGDVLLATPVARSLKRAWPQAELHYLVFKGTEGVLEGNPDIDQIIAVPHRTDWSGKFAQIRQLWQRYDLAVPVIASDRARLYGWVGAKTSVGFVGDWETGKKLLLDHWLVLDDRDAHVVSTGLRLTELLGIEPCNQVVPPAITHKQSLALFNRLDFLNRHGYVVLHPCPKYAYKMWRKDGWVELAGWLQNQGLVVVLTGGPGEDERSYADEIAEHVEVVNLVGKLSMAETAAVISRARLYVGPDTATTHIAAAVGVLTIALFGPSNPIKWGPWPRDWIGLESPWPWRGGGRRGNVQMIQGSGDCVPCLAEGCDRHIGSDSLCLQRISSDALIAVAREMLAEPQPIPIG